MSNVVHLHAPARPLDKAWENINALGSTCPQNEWEKGYCDAIGHALEELEKLGATDPCVRRIMEALDG